MIFGINASLAPYICLGGDAYADGERAAGAALGKPGKADGQRRFRGRKL